MMVIFKQKSCSCLLSTRYFSCTKFNSSRVPFRHHLFTIVKMSSKYRIQDLDKYLLSFRHLLIRFANISHVRDEEGFPMGAVYEGKLGKHLLE